jgi:hypothetical protein
MPPVKSKQQAKFMYAMENQQAKTGHNKTGMSMGKLKEFTNGVKTKALPTKVKRKKK